ncbi:MAG: LPS assembly protein LptD [Desulfomonile sp.]
MARVCYRLLKRHSFHGQTLRRGWAGRCTALVLSVLLVGLHPAYSQVTGPEDSSSSVPSKKSTILPADIPIQLSADRLSFDYENNTYTARGNVSLSQGNTRLRADSVRYDGGTGELTATGSVIARMGSDVVEAEKVTIKLSDSSGILFNGKLLLKRHNVYLEGKKLEKAGESAYRVTDGSFTTCDGISPAWRITGKDLDVTLEGYGKLKHGVFYVKDIPVFYLPWLIYPAKRKRQTGFLAPTFANSSIKGVDLRLPFFIDISPSVDATIIPRICTRRAAQAALEFRYFPSESFSGRFYGEYTYDWKYQPYEVPKNHRFFVTFRHDQEIAGQVGLKAHGTWVSDRDYFEFWGGRFDRRLRIRYLESNAVLFKQSNFFLFQAEARHFDNLDLPDNALTVQNIPTITGTLFSLPLAYTPFYLNSDVVYDHFYAPRMNEHWLGSRVQLDTRLTMPVAIGRYLKLEPSMTYLGKAYSADYYRRDKSISSVNSLRTDLYQINTDIFADLNSVYDGSLLGFQRIQHTIRPRFAWTYRPPSLSKQIYPHFDDSDRMDRLSLLTAEMRQTLSGRIGPGEYLDFVTLSVSQGYDFFDSRTAEDPLGERQPVRFPWTNTQAELTVKPHYLVDLTAQAQYDPVLNRARKYSLNLGLMDHRGDLFRVLHQYTEDDKREDLNRQTNVNLQLKLSSTLDCIFENQYSHQFNFSYFTSLGLSYHPQCWNVVLRYSEVREQDPVTQRIKEPDQTVFVTLSLYGLGQVYRFTRDWRELLGGTETTALSIP